MKEAMLYTRQADGTVRCELCRHTSRIKDSEYGICQVRYNDGGTLYSKFYGRPVAMNADPIEKKPLFHYRHGSYAMYIATPSCNFRCEFCQNWEISQARPENTFNCDLPAEKVVRLAARNGCASLASTAAAEREASSARSVSQPSASTMRARRHPKRPAPRAEGG